MAVVVDNLCKKTAAARVRITSFPCERHESVWRRRGIIPLICLPRQQMKLIGQLHAPFTLPREKSPRYPLKMRVDGPNIRRRHIGKEENLLLFAGNRTSLFSVVHPIA